MDTTRRSRRLPPTAPTAAFNESSSGGPAASRLPWERINTFWFLRRAYPDAPPVFDDPVEESLSALPYLYPCLMSHAPVPCWWSGLGTNDTKERLGANACAIGKGPAPPGAEGTVPSTAGRGAAQPSDCRPARHRKGSGAISCGPGDGTGLRGKIRGPARPVPGGRRRNPLPLFWTPMPLAWRTTPLTSCTSPVRATPGWAAAVAERIPTLF